MHNGTGCVKSCLETRIDDRGCHHLGPDDLVWKTVQLIQLIWRGQFGYSSKWLDLQNDDFFKTKIHLMCSKIPLILTGPWFFGFPPISTQTHFFGGAEMCEEKKTSPLTTRTVVVQDQLNTAITVSNPSFFLWIFLFHPKILLPYEPKKCWQLAWIILPRKGIHCTSIEVRLSDSTHFKMQKARWEATKPIRMKSYQLLVCFFFEGFL